MKMMKMSHLFLLDFVVVLLVLIASASADAEHAEEDVVPPKEIIPHPDLPDFQEGVTVRVLDRLESCARVAASGNWLELQFVAKQMNDDGENYEEFDSTESRGRPLYIAVDDKEKLPGLTEGLRDVCVGEKREITIQAGSPLMQVDPRSGLNQPQTDRPAVYEVMVRSILDQQPVNMFAKIDLDSNNELSREELKTYFREHGLEGMTDDDTLDIVVEGLIRSNDMDNNDHLSDAEFPHPYEHIEL
ncbi:peptidyl-prolyl cis-trans isomerase FKBP14-like isoform X2 [Patiria miniata]|uniref:peptidylprolyl isomerase n=1 Tax=Patiria miniata TaxID=46514 RepID=A0A913ZAK8_PATMI|nr:peptidyl-prolyl cis-trans isomerase FKBP14-like isoform X2 [Patiria miniata]